MLYRYICDTKEACVDYDGDGISSIYEAVIQQDRVDELCEAKYAFGEDRELDIYIDESGNLDSRASSSAWYIMCFVLKESSVSTEEEEGKLEEEFSRLGYPGPCFHTGPLIHGKDEYEGESLENRKKLLMYFSSFFNHLDVSHVEFSVKRKNKTKEDVQRFLANEIVGLIKMNLSYFISFSSINVHYDFGQKIVSNILIEAFRRADLELNFVKESPKESRLMQVADYAATVKLLRMKLEKGDLSRCEILCLGGERRFKRIRLKEVDGKDFRTLMIEKRRLRLKY